MRFLDREAFGSGAHRLSEMAARLGGSATSLARPLLRLQELGLLAREQPFGDPERGGKRSLYRIGDPFARMWFRVVAPHRAALAAGGPATRAALWQRHSGRLVAEAWEDLCRTSVPRLPDTVLGAAGPWGPARRFWKGNGPEWDVVAASVDAKVLLLGEVKWSEQPFSEAELQEAGRSLLAKGVPRERWAEGKRPIHVVFVPQLRRARRRTTGNRAFEIVTGTEVLAALR